MAVLASLAGLLGLVGGVVGAVLTAAAQERAARRTREAAIHAAARDAVRDLIASSDILAGLYEAVWQLDDGKTRPEAAYERAVAAWAEYQHARARVRLAAPDEVYEATTALDAALKVEIDVVDLYYQRAKRAERLTQEQVDDGFTNRAQAQADMLARLDRTVPLPAWPIPAASRGGWTSRQEAGETR